MRGRWAHSPIQRFYLERAWALAKGDWTPPSLSDSPPPNFNLYPKAEDIRDWAKWRGRREGAAVDIECAGRILVCIGFCSLETEHGFCVRFRSRGGAVWGEEDLEARAEATYEVLADPTIRKVFHNGQSFDVPYLEDIGFEVAGYYSDTMLQAHLTYAEHPKKLEFLANIYADMPPWKQLVKDTDEAEDK